MNSCWVTCGERARRFLGWLGDPGAQALLNDLEEVLHQSKEVGLERCVGRSSPLGSRSRPGCGDRLDTGGGR